MFSRRSLRQLMLKSVNRKRTKSDSDIPNKSNKNNSDGFKIGIASAISDCEDVSDECENDIHYVSFVHNRKSFQNSLVGCF